MFNQSHASRQFLETLESRQMLAVVTDFQFQFLNAPQRIVVQFNSNEVAASLGPEDLQLQNHSTVFRIPTMAIALVSFDMPTATATFEFPGLASSILPDGNYRARVLASGVTNLTQDGVLDFFVYSGDANHDRSIDLDDFGAIAANFNGPGNFASGDFDYNKVTDIADFAILASRFNQSLTALAAPATRYTVTVLPGVGGAFGSLIHPYALNDNGHTVGVIHQIEPIGPGEDASFSWQPGDPTLKQGPGDRGTGVSNSGVIVGFGDDNNQFAGVWTHSSTTEQFLPNLRGVQPGGSAKALAINNSSIIVGVDSQPQQFPPFTPKGVRWPTFTTVQEVGGTMATAINDDGDIVGVGPTLYPSTGGPPVNIAAPGSGGAIDINDASEVVGILGPFSIAHHFSPKLYETVGGEPFYWRPGLVDPFMLEHAPHDNNVRDVQARAINNAGQIVGDGDNVPGVQRGAVIWHQGMPYDLATMLEPHPQFEIQLEGAADINENGQIIGYGQIVPNPVPGNFRRALLLTPVPAGQEGRVPPVTFADPADAAAIARMLHPVLAAPSGESAQQRWSNRLVGALDDLL